MEDFNNTEQHYTESTLQGGYFLVSQAQISHHQNERGGASLNRPNE